MARPPYNPVPESSASGPAGEFENVNPSPADFGGLQAGATQKLGADLGQAGDAATNIAVQFQNRQNQIVASDAFNKMQTQALNITAGDPTDKTKPGYFALQGKDAMDAYSGASQALESARQNISSGLANDAQRLAFEESSRRLQMFTLDSMRSHFIQQQSVYGRAVTQASQQTAMRAIGTQPANDQTFNDNLAQMRHNAYREELHNGNEGDPDILHAAVAKAEETAIVGRVQAMQAADPINGASAALDWIKNGQIPDTPVPGKPQTFSSVASHLSPNMSEQLNQHFRATADRSSVAEGIANVTGGTPPQTQARGAATNSAWQRLEGAEGGTDANGGALVSPKGASGVSQMLPQTAQETAQKHGIAFDPKLIQPGQDYDNSYSRMLGRLHFGDLMQQYGGNVTLATAAYNAGSGRVDQWIQQNGDPRKGTISEADWTAQIPIDETRNYVQRIALPSSSANVAPPSTGGQQAPQPAGGSGVAPGFDASGQPLPVGWTDQSQPAASRPTSPPQTDNAPSLTPTPGTTTHSPASYGIEAGMVENAWKEAQQRFPNRPDLQKELVNGVYEHIQQMNVLQAKFEAEQAKAQKEAEEGAGQSVMKQLLTDPTKFDMSTISSNPALDWRQKETLYEVARKHLAESGQPDTSGYGSGYAAAFHNIVSPDNESDRITSTLQLMKRADQGGDLTLQGADVLSGVLSRVAKSPDERAIATTESSFLAYAKRKLSFEDDTGPVKIRDPKGEDIFNAQFIPMFERGLADARQTGKPQDVQNYLSRDNIDKMLGGLRSQTDMAKDRLNALGISDQPVEAPGTPIPPPPVITPARPEEPSPEDNLARNQAYLAPGSHTYNTQLSSADEGRFRQWVTNNKVPFDPNAKVSDYDMRGFWKTSQDPEAWKALQQSGKIPEEISPAGTKVDPNDGRPHYPDWWKTPFHQTFSNESQWAGPNAPHWTDDDKLMTPDGKVVFDDRAQETKPVQVDPTEWSHIMTVVPKAPNGQPYTHQAWSDALKMLLSNPKTMGPKFDEFFAPGGFSSADIMKRLTSKGSTSAAAGATAPPVLDPALAGMMVH